MSVHEIGARGGNALRNGLTYTVAALAVLASMHPADAAPKKIEGSASSMSANAFAAKSFGKVCKRLVKKRDANLKPLKPKEKRKLKNCGVNFPNIIGSTKDTKYSKLGIFYNYGPAPTQNGWYADESGNKVFPDEVYRVGDNSYEQAMFVRGALKHYTDVSADYFSDCGYVPTGFEDRCESVVTQPMPKQKPTVPGAVIDVTFQDKFCSYRDEISTVVAGLRTLDSTPETIVQGSITLNPGECKTIAVSDSAGMPPTNDESIHKNSSPEGYFNHFMPDQATSLRFRDVNVAEYYWKVYSDDPNLDHSGTRAVLTGKEADLSTYGGELNSTLEPAQQPFARRGW